ncbi:MAG TPA: hypothetical protein ENK15_01895 [Thermopetrobacter sp.]|nr:hypothetical protein [Thermopetrobacter sp.]
MWKNIAQATLVSTFLAMGGMSAMAFSAVVGPGGPGSGAPGGGGGLPRCAFAPNLPGCDNSKALCCHRKKGEFNGRYHCHRATPDLKPGHCRVHGKRMQNFSAGN